MRPFNPFLILFLLCIGHSSFAQDNAISIRVCEVFENCKLQPKIIISDGDKEYKTIPLKYIGKDPAATDNLTVITRTLNEYLKEGYKIISEACFGAGECGAYTTYILRKE